MALCVFLIINDSEYLFSGKTYSLNEAVNEQTPLDDTLRGKFVELKSSSAMGNYAETRDYICGFIPTPFNSQEYAVLLPGGQVISVKVTDKGLIDALEKSTEGFYSDDVIYSEFTLTGKLQSAGSEMKKYLDELLVQVAGENYADYGFVSTYYEIDTTENRVTLFFMYGFLMLISVALIVITVKKLRTPLAGAVPQVQDPQQTMLNGEAVSRDYPSFVDTDPGEESDV
jgi:hypothetical protein